MPPQLREIGFHVENHATQWHGFQHEIQFQEVVVAWIQLTQINLKKLQVLFIASTDRTVPHYFYLLLL